MTDDPMVGAVVRLLDAPLDPRNGAFFRITESWGSPPRYAAHDFVGFTAPPGEHVRIVRGGLWNVRIEEPADPSAATATMALPPSHPRPPALTPSHQKRPSLLAGLLGFHTTDALLSRRQTWVGAVIRAVNVPETDPYYGTYWRVRESRRNADGTFHIASDYLGTEPPPGPIYLFDGITWDLPAVPSTVFPKWVPLGIAAMLGFGFLFLLAVGSQVFSDEGTYLGLVLAVVVLVGFVIAMIVYGTCWSWFYRVEPVRGSKALAAMAVAHEVHMRSNDGTEYSNPGRVDWGFTQAARDRAAAKEEQAARVSEIDQAIAKAVDEDRRRRGHA